ncbi:hypothetical protein [Amycolatopsis keratiniphila]|uniref:Uncharacterized protein n=1 Tax=Amycolatopsis keratiniphila TaxID=129921 RepID=R4T626_9PSEU|nr:hypothetical protein [Amycolatopsis keratiniphila]AGM07851.1 hypothetical protein AORI_5268 [Amycolatopsis keratiniphila]
MKVFDPEGREWAVDRRFAPWRRWVQPFAGLAGGYRHYKLTPDWGLYLDDEPKARDEAEDNGPLDKVATGAFGLLVFLEALVHVPIYLLLGLFLMPFLVLESLCQGVAGLVAMGVRRFRRAPVRVDVLAWHKKQSGLASLTILRVHDDLAGPLIIELGALVRDRVMFDPGDPAVHETLTRFGARVERHRTLLRWRAVRR